MTATRSMATFLLNLWRRRVTIMIVRAMPTGHNYTRTLGAASSAEIRSSLRSLAVAIDARRQGANMCNRHQHAVSADYLHSTPGLQCYLRHRWPDSAPVLHRGAATLAIPMLINQPPRALHN